MDFPSPYLSTQNGTWSQANCCPPVRLWHLVHIKANFICRAIPESRSTFTLVVGLVGESQQLFENGIIFANLLSVCSQFALNFYHIYFNCIFHPQGGTFWINFDLRAHIRIFQTFRICINFYPILKIEPAMLDLLSTFLDMLWEQKIGFFAFFGLGNSDTFYVC